MGRLGLGLTLVFSGMAHADISALSEMPPKTVDYYYNDYLSQGAVSDQAYGQIIGDIQSNRKRTDANKTETMQQECKETRRWKLVLVQRDLVRARDQIQSAKDVLENDKKAARISGYENGAIRNLAAWSILDSQDKVKQLFAQYRALGGTAPNAQKVGRLSDKDYFCEDISAQTKRGLPTIDEANAYFAEMKAGNAEVEAKKAFEVEKARNSRSCSDAYNRISQQSRELSKIIRGYHNPKGDLDKLRAYYLDAAPRFSFVIKLKTDPIVVVEMVDPTYPTKEIALELKTAIENINMVGMGCEAKFRINL